MCHFKVARPYYIDGCPLREESVSKDLGVHIDTSLKFHKHIQIISNKAGGLASNLLRSTVCRSPQFMKTLFISQVRSIFDYCSPLWNTCYLGDLRLLENVQRRWTKQVDGFSHLSYKERLLSLDLYSIKGRLLRSNLIY